MAWRLIKWAARLLFALVVLAGLAGFYLFYRAMPVYSGAEKLPGLSAEARVWRDAHGVPHIFAASMDDAIRTLGYLHASERLFQMEIQRRVGQGRMAEIQGADLLGVDKHIRTLGFYQEAQSSFAALSPWAQKRFQAYADGVNAFLESHRDALPPEFLLAGIRPEPWKPADSLVWAKLLSLQLSHNYRLEALRAIFARSSTPNRWLGSFPRLKQGAPITTLPVIDAQHASDDTIQDQIGELIGIGRGASNEWVVAGSRTVTGKPILANDPHLELSAPILWYLARIVTPEGSVKGATVPGEPLVLLGQNDNIAWGFTTADTDVQDLFIETIDPSDPSKYLTPDGPKPFETRDETIHVKDGADVKLTVRTTRHGPVLSDVSADLASLAAPGKVLALAYTGLSGHDTTAEAVISLNTARNWGEFLDALKLYQTPTQNIVYADVSGDIGFFSPGLVPIRKSGDGQEPVDGASGAFDWVGMIPVRSTAAIAQPGNRLRIQRQQRRCLRRPSTVIRAGLEEDFRARRIQQFFDTIDKHSLETSAAMQADHLSLAAKDFQPFIARIIPSDERARQAQALLMNWDAVMDKNRVEPAHLHLFPPLAAPESAGGKNGRENGRNGTFRRRNAPLPHAQPSLLV